MLAVGFAANRSIRIFARLLRRPSPRSSPANSRSVQRRAILVNASPENPRVSAIPPKFTSPACNSMNVNDFLGYGGRSSRVVYNGMVHSTDRLAQTPRLSRARSDRQCRRAWPPAPVRAQGPQLQNFPADGLRTMCQQLPGCWAIAAAAKPAPPA